MALTNTQIYFKVLGIQSDLETVAVQAPPPIPCWISNMAQSMASLDGPRGGEHRGRIDAGYTYLGQLISHDIVKPTSSRQQYREVSGSLSLDSFYGPTLTKNDFLTNDRFVLQRGGRDFWRNSEDKAVIPEPRNDDNLIVAQLQLFWQQLHNALLDSRCANSSEAARKLVVLIFQLVVVEDYLRQVLDPRVYDHVVVKGERYFQFDRSTLNPLFTHAAFRFGHSMVRATYNLRPGFGRTLRQLFRANRPIRDHHHIEWDQFFSLDGHAQQSDAIDTVIVLDMGAVPPLDDNSPTVNIIKANIAAGWSAKLLPGHSLFMRLVQGWDGLKQPPDEVGLTPIASSRMHAFGTKLTDLPLWPYILLESEVHHRGRHLGVLGSLIVAESVRNSVESASPSVFDKGVFELEPVLESMGKVGKLIAGIAQDNRPTRYPERRVAMAHILKLLEELKNG